MQGMQINRLAFYGEKTLIKFETLPLTKIFIRQVKSCLVKRIDKAFSKIIDEVAPWWSIWLDQRRRPRTSRWRAIWGK